MNDEDKDDDDVTGDDEIDDSIHVLRASIKKIGRKYSFWVFSQDQI